MNHFLTVKDFGAAGDGATDDRAAIQAAVDDVASKGGGGIYFPRGTYLVSGSIFYRDNLRFVGEHRDVVTIRLADGSNGSVFDGHSRTKVAFENLSVDGNREGAEGLHGLRGRYVNGFYVYRCRIENANYYGIGLQWGADDKDPQPERNVHLSEVVIRDCTADGIDVKYGLDIHCTNVEISNCGRRGFDLRGRRIFLNNIKALANNWTGVTCRGNSGNGAAAIPNPPHFMLSNVYADSNGQTGIVVFQDKGMDEGRVALSSCLSQSNGDHGIDVPRGGRHPTVTCLSACVARSNNKSGIRAMEDNVTITGCQMIGNGAWGFDNDGRNLRQVVVGNIALGNKSGQIREAGTRGTHANNLTS